MSDNCTPAETSQHIYYQARAEKLEKVTKELKARIDALEDALLGARNCLITVPRSQYSPERKFPDTITEIEAALKPFEKPKGDEANA